jgi:hypothetical protein
LLVAKAAKTAERGPNYAPTDPPRGAQAAHVLGSLAPSVLIPPVIENAGIVESLSLPAWMRRMCASIFELKSIAAVDKRQF